MRSGLRRVLPCAHCEKRHIVLKAENGADQHCALNNIEHASDIVYPWFQKVLVRQPHCSNPWLAGIVMVGIDFAIIGLVRRACPQAACIVPGTRYQRSTMEILY